MNKIFKFLIPISSLVLFLITFIIFVIGINDAIKEGLSNNGEKIKIGMFLWLTFISSFGSLFASWKLFKNNDYIIALLINSFYLITIILILATQTEILAFGWFNKMHIFLIILVSIFSIIDLFLVLRHKQIKILGKGK